MRNFYLQREFPAFLEAHSVGGFFIATLIKLGRLWLFYIGPALTIPFLFLPLVLRDRRIRWLLFAGALSLAGTVLIVFFMAHYVAPITAVIVAVMVQGTRHLRVWRWDGKPTGIFLVRALVMICVLMAPLEVRMLAAPPVAGSWETLGPERAKLEAQLDSLPEEHLVLVRYKPNHDVMAEWVYNRADINDAKVVWARDMGPADNQELIRYYKNRRLWLLEADETPPRLLPYQSSETGRASAAGPQTPSE